MIIGRAVSILFGVAAVPSLLLALAELTFPTHPDTFTALETTLTGIALVMVATVCLLGAAVLTVLLHIAGSLDRRSLSESHESVLSASREHVAAGSAR